MPIQRLRTEVRYSEAVIHNGTVYLAGQFDEAFAEGAGAQTRATLAAIDALLAEVGSSSAKLLSATIYLKDMADYAPMNAIWDAWLPAGCAPARTCVEAALYDPRVRVEITITAAV